ncbi:predicted protein [Pyrenophora tritici-repentis Pt-1C-BFP]|uniref:Uncharacterized protein n=1 Tax=Pyrenophora tritici-repentis (strain Pt-1C-BFP) TaxID=426418 RepID=B2WN90_PYRTR|nr:uncharacterized protein PTRG_11347 [Pyrenophora tritici-repentis Pt-1C-BFP]EDU44397.1 predicted protein [Pyrenophora tritici-repentis Pt-1C-BFP]
MKVYIVDSLTSYVVMFEAQIEMRMFFITLPCHHWGGREAMQKAKDDKYRGTEWAKSLLY